MDCNKNKNGIVNSREIEGEVLGLQVSGIPFHWKATKTDQHEQ